MVSWKTEHFFQQFDLAKDNMSFDKNLLDALEPDSRRFRLYRWQHMGLTYGHKQALPPALASVDHAPRPTGGGIVFHSPGDIVFSLSAWLTDPAFPSRIKSKIPTLSRAILPAFKAIGISLVPGALQRETDYAFCHSYPNPDELLLGNDKIVAFTLRKFRDRFLIQGIIHVTENVRHFGNFEAYTNYFSKGLSIPATTQDHLFKSLADISFEVSDAH